MLDLHGYTINEAHKKFVETIDHFHFAGYKKLTVITGSGEISKEITMWAENSKYIRDIHRQDPNKGSYLVLLNKKKVQATVRTEPVDLSPLLQKFNVTRR